jgi:hypothetical protein
MSSVQAEERKPKRPFRLLLDDRAGCKADPARRTHQGCDVDAKFATGVDNFAVPELTPGFNLLAHLQQ